MDIHYYETIAAEINGIKPESIFIRTRKTEILTARQMCIYYRKKVLRLTNAIAAGRYGLDHSTANHAIRAMDDHRETNKQFSGVFDDFILRSLELRAIEAKRLMDNPEMFDGVEDVPTMIAKILFEMMVMLRCYSDRNNYQLSYILKQLDSIESDIGLLKETLTQDDYKRNISSDNRG